MIDIVLVGAGGGGGGAYESPSTGHYNPGAGGGGGMVIEKRIYDTTGTMTITIGSKGVGGSVAGVGGSDGGNSTLTINNISIISFGGSGGPAGVFDNSTIRPGRGGGYYTSITISASSIPENFSKSYNGTTFGGQGGLSSYYYPFHCSGYGLSGAGTTRTISPYGGGSYNDGGVYSGASGNPIDASGYGGGGAGGSYIGGSFSGKTGGSNGAPGYCRVIVWS